MSSETDSSGPRVVDVRSRSDMKDLTSVLDDLPVDPPSIYLDAEGGMQAQWFDLIIFVPSRDTIYVIPYNPNIYSPPSGPSEGPRLCDILENVNIPKIGFDVRNLAFNLFDRGNIASEGFWDLQLMELGSRQNEPSRKYVAPFKKCVNQDLPPSNAARRRWLQPADTGNLHRFNVLGHVPRETMRKVELYPSLWDVYHRRLSRPKNAFWLHSVGRESDRRVQQALSPSSGFHPNARENAIGPSKWWNQDDLDFAIQAWKDETRATQGEVEVVFEEDD